MLVPLALGAPASDGSVALAPSMPQRMGAGWLRSPWMAQLVGGMLASSAEGGGLLHVMAVRMVPWVGHPLDREREVK